MWCGTPGGRDDAALVRVDDSAWVAPVGRPVVWGRVVTSRPGIECVTWGVPDRVQRPGEPVEAAQLSGRVNPGDRYVGNRYVMAVDGHPQASLAGGGSPWAGLSGGALFCGDRLAGVIAADEEHSGHARLVAVPMYVVHHDEEFRAVMAAHTGVESMVLEPVEFQSLVEPPLAVISGGVLPSPGWLLTSHS